MKLHSARLPVCRWVNAFDFPLCKRGIEGDFREQKLLEINSQIESSNNPKSDSEEG